ncbi:MAG: hypothetical protein ABIE07_10920 [Candidatus Zixiibacteriota bacterium]
MTLDYKNDGRMNVVEGIIKIDMISLETNMGPLGNKIYLFGHAESNETRSAQCFWDYEIDKENMCVIIKDEWHRRGLWKK